MKISKRMDKDFSFAKLLFMLVFVLLQCSVCIDLEVSGDLPPLEYDEDHVQHPKHQPQSNELKENMMPNAELLQPIDDGHTESTNSDNAKEKIDLTIDINLSIEPVGLEITTLKESDKNSESNVNPDLESSHTISVDALEGTEQNSLLEINESGNITDLGNSDTEGTIVIEKHDVTTDDTEKEIPSFKEYREQKEKETGKDDQRKSESIVEIPVEKPKGKLIQKNYADNLCGANIVGKKKEFKNCDTILNNNKDLYGMIACEGSIWFVVELCDTVQIQAIQLANHELFSSSVREFKIYTAENYPPKEWMLIGTFETVNNREIQKFDIDNNVEYSKYVKFEKVSFRGKEHFCVLSKFEVLGISMVDEYEENQMPQVLDLDPYDQPLNTFTEELLENGSDKSLIEDAKNAVKNIVDSALNVLGVSKNEDKTKNAISKNISEHTRILPEEEKQVTPTEESVVIKVDETGREIKDNLKTDEKRLKGEIGEQLDKNTNLPYVENINTPDVIINIPQQGSIMEGVDLSDFTAELERSLNNDNSKPVTISEEGIPIIEIKFDSLDNKESVETLEKLHDTENTGRIMAEKNQDTEKDGKGVVMTNSPKKNSIFVDLDKKIRELQKNLSLSNDYLETLSSRYKRVENLFKPLEKTLSTVDESVINFEERLKSLEAKFDKFDFAVDAYVNHIKELHTKSNTLITTTNLTLFLLLLILFVFWRSSGKIHEILCCVMPKSKLNSFPQDKASSANESIAPQKRLKPKSKDISIKKRDLSTDIIKSHMSESNLSRQALFTENKKITEYKKPLESVQMDLIYPQVKSPTLKRRPSKNVR